MYQTNKLVIAALVQAQLHGMDCLGTNYEGGGM